MLLGKLIGIPTRGHPVTRSLLIAGLLIVVGACSSKPDVPVSSKQTARVLPNRCGISNPVEIAWVNIGAERPVSIVPPAKLDRYMTGPLAAWQARVRQAALYYFNTPVASITNISSYACRRIGGRANGRLSNHALGLALDISGFRLADGRIIDVAADWGRDTPQGRFLLAAHQEACRSFDIVLGPNYNRAHRNHFHVDMGGGGGFCR